MSALYSTTEVTSASGVHDAAPLGITVGQLRSAVYSNKQRTPWSWGWYRIRTLMFESSMPISPTELPQELSNQAVLIPLFMTLYVTPMADKYILV